MPNNSTMPTENPLITKALETAREMYRQRKVAQEQRVDGGLRTDAAALLRAQITGLMSAGEPPHHECNTVYRQRMERELAALRAAAKELEARHV